MLEHGNYPNHEQERPPSMAAFPCESRVRRCVSIGLPEMHAIAATATPRYFAGDTKDDARHDQGSWPCPRRSYFRVL